MVGGHWRDEHITSREPGGHRVGLDDGAWIEHGHGAEHGKGTGGAYGVRIDGMGVGDVGEVHGRARGIRHATCNADCWGTQRQYEPGMVGGRYVDELGVAK